MGVRRLAGVCVALVLLVVPAAASDHWRHGLSLVGEPKYAGDFRHFDYVDPNAPKGGVVRLGVGGGFDNFNPVVVEVRGNLSAGLSEVYETLMTSALDEISTEYGALAEAVTHPDDFSSVTFRLNPAARWHDGVPVTPADVIFSFDAWKRLSPSRNKYYANVVKAEDLGGSAVRFTFDVANNRELPLIVGQLMVLPKHWWEGTRPDGTKRDIAQPTLEPPLGSGPYRIARFEAGRTVTLERVKDYWGAAIPTRVGKNNFDEIRYEYFGDPNALFDGFKADLYDFRIENSSRNWAVNYDFPAVAQGRVVREQFPLLNLGRMQAFVPNLRRARFADERVRRAMNLAFNFEDMNRTVFFGLYERIDSYFWGTELASAGLPDARELALLEPLRGKVPEGVFTARFANPINADDAAVRANLREAVGLMREAGYELRGGKLVSTADGQPFTIEFLTEASMGQLAQRFLVPYQQALERIGFTVTLRVVDDVQYETRKRNFDFDVLAIESWGQSLSPGNEQREYWGSAAADIPGSRNLLGLKDPAVDALIDAIIFAPDRETLVAATRALDRVLLAKNLVISQWGKNTLWTARYDRFSAPPVLPKYGAGGFPEVWWYDPAKAARISGG